MKKFVYSGKGKSSHICSYIPQSKVSPSKETITRYLVCANIHQRSREIAALYKQKYYEASKEKIKQLQNNPREPLVIIGFRGKFILMLNRKTELIHFKN